MNELNEAAELLRAGKVVIFPTESSYGMGASISSEMAIKKVFELKGRPDGKALPVIAYDLNQMRPFAEITEDVKKLSGKFHPGPLTLVVKSTGNVPSVLSGDTIAFRISSHPFARELCRLVGKPITATSANLAGEPAVYSPEKAVELFPEVFVVDGGTLKPRPASTIFDVSSRKLLRKGPVEEADILAVLD